MKLVRRRVGSQTVLWSEALAGRLGIHPTDVETMDILARLGPITAGELAIETGLTTAAVTKLLDRLEARGFAKRVRDTRDRRRVHVELQNERTMAEVMPLYEELTQAAAELHQRYSEEEVRLIEGFLRETQELLRRETERLRREADQNRPGLTDTTSMAGASRRSDPLLATADPPA